MCTYFRVQVIASYVKCLHIFLCAATQECGIPAASYTRDIEPDIDILSSTPAEGIDSQWTLFKSKHGSFVVKIAKNSRSFTLALAIDITAQHTKLLAYMDKEWMSDDWKWLWMEAGRSYVSHYSIRTSNVAEEENRQVKGSGGPILDGRACSDAVVVIKAEIGLPTDLDSIQRSYVMARAVRIAHVMGGDTNMRLPRRVFISPMRVKLAEIFASPLNVLDVKSSVGQLYDVADAKTRSQISAGIAVRAPTSRKSGEICPGYYRVSIYHGHHCKDGTFFCKHLLAARRKHRELGRPRCWRDSELAPYYTDPAHVGGGLSVSELFSQASADLVPATAQDINVQLEKQIEVLNSKFIAVTSAMKQLSLSAQRWSPLLEDATRETYLAAASRARGLSHLTASLAGAEKRALELAGVHRVSTAGVQTAPRSARSTEEVDSQRRTQLSYTGSVPSASAASMLTTTRTDSLRTADSLDYSTALLPAASVNPVHAPVQRKRVRVQRGPVETPASVDATAEMQPAQTALSHAAETPSASATELRRTIETKNATIRALHEDINQLKQQIVDLHDVSHANKSDARDAGFIAGKTEAYRDCEARTREVAASVWYVNERPSREALLHLASGFQRLSSDPDLS